MNISPKYGDIIFAIMVGVVLFYLPFVSRQFMGDDWLWLANAKMALSDPTIFLERPMYGYFRPLNMVIVFLWLHLFGAKAFAFSMVSILLHVGNIWLLWKLLGKFDVPESVRNLSAFIFGFYALNASAIEWISVSHDLWVTGLSLIFAMRVLKLIEKPSNLLFLQVLMLGLAAVLIKESGFITIGIYYLLMIYKRKFPFHRDYRLYSIILISTYFLYIFAYFSTRTVVDRQLELGVDTIVNLWYFMSYIAAPISKRIAESFPAQLIWMLKFVKITVALMVPVVLIYAYRKAGIGIRFFILWTIMFISTISILEWNIHPFSLYPDRTAARFMYSAVPGMAVVSAWMVILFFGKFKRIFGKAYVKTFLVVGYVLLNFLITYRISRLYFHRQDLAASIVNNIDRLDPILVGCHSMVVLTNDKENTPQIVSSGIHLQAMIYINSGCNLDVSVENRENYSMDDLGKTSGTIMVAWEADELCWKLPTTMVVADPR